VTPPGRAVSSSAPAPTPATIARGTPATCWVIEPIPGSGNLDGCGLGHPVTQPWLALFASLSLSRVITIHISNRLSGSGDIQ
jgi:hypothetical protein